MSLSTCKACGAPVELAELADGSQLALEHEEDPASEAQLYRITGQNPTTAEPVMAGSIRGLPRHDFDCPGGNNGRR